MQIINADLQINVALQHDLVINYMGTIPVVFREALTWSHYEDGLSCRHSVKPLTHSLIHIPVDTPALILP